MSKISVVIPCYNEYEVIQETNKNVSKVLEDVCKIFQMEYEIIYVNDGSKDNTLQILHFLQDKHNYNEQKLGKINIVSLAKNFGHQAALSAGLHYAKGDAIISIDADLQDPPELIELMIKKWLDGSDVIYGVRTSREGETFFKLLTAKLFYILLRKLTHVDIPIDSGDFRLMSRNALNIFNTLPERNRFIRGMVPWIGLRQEPIYYERSARFAGETKYPFRKMLKLAFDGIISFSNVPLQSAYYFGFIVALLSIIYGFYIVIYSLVKGYPVLGWSSLMVAILFIGAVQLITIGVLGEYIGRIYDEVKKRPLFIVNEKESRLN
ncbi:glycosyltransferase family 2 protein [Fluviispira multicolorata]|uniref:Glycosyltransferase n=1 Tax=Fluviispira multicolorata TaxID=2654512 RepID=A0A833JEL6_9BACT|nr:glycosyltransferase [Fluviispira multicolorata]KAB8029914.1 glycosyltransferase [Fluviispira multicolorata]